MGSFMQLGVVLVPWWAWAVSPPARRWLGLVGRGAVGMWEARTLAQSAARQAVLVDMYGPPVAGALIERTFSLNT